MEDRIIDKLADIRRQAQAARKSSSEDAMEEAAMAQILGTRCDQATGIEPLIPRSDLLETHAHDFDVEFSSTARDSTSARDEEMTEIRGAVRDLVAG